MKHRTLGIMILILSMLCMGVGISIAAEEAKQQTYVPKTIVDVPWGKAPEEFGILNGPGTETIGPRFFAIDKKNNIYIFDIVKNNIKQFDKDGNFVGNIGADLPTGSSMALGVNGHIFVQRGHFIDEYLQNGKLLKTHEISRDINLIFGSGQGIRFDEFGHLYVNRGYAFYKVGKEEKGIFKALSHKEQKESEITGVPGIKSDRRLKTKVNGKHLAMLQVLDDASNVLKEIVMQTPNMFGTVRVIGQDDAGYVYIRVGIILGLKARIGVRKFDAMGNIIASFEVPSHYYTLPDKMFELDETGNVYQLLTTPKGVQIIKWEQK